MCPGSPLINMASKLLWGWKMELFLSREELKALVESCDVEGVDFEALWEECVPLFDDGLPLVSLDAMLFVHTKKIEDRVAALHSGTGPGLAAYKGAL
eukprot:g32193.t1